MNHMKEEIYQSVYQELQPIFVKIDSRLEEINSKTIEITEIPAPPFNEENRAEFIRQQFDQLGYITKIDEVGNVHASKTSKPELPIVIISAHLDTVFQNEDIQVVRDGDILRAPGIGDDSRGLTNLLIIAEYLKQLDTDYPVVFISTVGEEGLGDLRGVKWIFNNEYNPEDVRAFITIDGTDVNRVVNQGVGSIRHKVVFSGPGGHSYGSFGLVNPAFAAGEFMHKMGEIEVPENPRTTYSVGTLKGGTAINAIPETIEISIDLRSEDSDHLQKLEKRAKNLAAQAVKKENKKRNEKVKVEFNQVGLRPAGKLEEEHWLCQSVIRVHEQMNLDLEFSASSTDANVPLSMNCPAISVSSVNKAGRAHSQEEWIKADKESLTSLKRNLYLAIISASFHE